MTQYFVVPARDGAPESDIDWDYAVAFDTLEAATRYLNAGGDYKNEQWHDVIYELRKVTPL